MQEVAFKPIKLIKASAGAGKTHFLTREYINLILSGDADSFRHILAVTFTNKATEEMKSRVIEELHKISRNADDPRQEKAKERLTGLLHDYSHFSISTIDTFFQTVIRSFAREIGQYASYRVEIDTNSAISQTIDLLLDSLTEEGNRELYEWLKDYSLRIIEEGGTWNIAKPLESIAQLFFREDFKLKFREGDYAIRDREATKAFSDKVFSFIDEFREGMKIRTEAVFKAADEFSIDIEHDFKGKTRGPMCVFKKWRNGQFVQPKEDIMEYAASANKPGFTGKVADAVEFCLAHIDDYRTACLFKDEIHLLGVYSDIYAQLNGWLKDNNVILLGESTDLLCRIIDGSDTPFVYEKVGTRYDHIMLDEAQDTSLLQWRNFMPLFKESAASGLQNLVVGDIKQSIYRWRGSDWRLISDYIYDDLGRNLIDDSKSLDDNWRSSPSIIDFNNRIFFSIADTIEAVEPDIASGIRNIYSGSRQTLPSERRGGPEGQVKICFKDIPEMGESVIGRIGELTRAGYEFKDIAILTRSNSQSSEIADLLINRGIAVITEDSLLLESSSCICRVMDILRFSVNPQDDISRLLAGEYAEAGRSLPEASLYSVCESLVCEEGQTVTHRDVPFIHTFLDYALEYQEKYGSSIRGFVKWWDEGGSGKSINIPSGQNAVRVMTIHKAKGLSLEAVIVPYFEFRYLPLPVQMPTVWCRTEGRFSDIGLVPLKASSSLRNTCFEGDLDREKFYSYIDNVNLAYVAMTRAKSSLTVFARKPDDDRNSANKVLSVAHSLFNILEGELDGNLEYETGTLGFSRKADDSGKTQLSQNEFKITPAGNRLKVKMVGQDYFDDEVSPRLRGIEIHRILEYCNGREDLPHAVELCIAEGNLPSKDRKNAQRLLESAFDSLERDGYQWFDKSKPTLNEISIIDKDGASHRPDRIIIDDKTLSATVIDFKFGKRREAYNEQVANYCSLLKETGYKNVEGYLWFPALQAVFKVSSVD